MTTEQIGIIVGAVAAVAIVLALRKNGFSFKGNRRGFKIDNTPPEQKPGVSVEGAISHKGAIKVENNHGDGVAAKKLDAAKDISVTNNPGPKQ